MPKGCNLHIRFKVIFREQFRVCGHSRVTVPIAGIHTQVFHCTQICIQDIKNSDLPLGSYGTKPVSVFEVEITSWKPGILHITFSSV